MPLTLAHGDACQSQLIVQALHGIHSRHSAGEPLDWVGLLAIADLFEEDGSAAAIQRAELIRVEVQLHREQWGLLQLDATELQKLEARRVALIKEVYREFYKRIFGDDPYPDRSTLGRLGRALFSRIGFDPIKERIELLRTRLPLFGGFLRDRASNHPAASTLELHIAEVPLYESVLAEEPLVRLALDGYGNEEAWSSALGSKALANIQELRLGPAPSWDARFLHHLARNRNARNLRAVSCTLNDVQEGYKTAVDLLTAETSSFQLEALEIGSFEWTVRAFDKIFQLSPRPSIRTLHFNADLTAAPPIERIRAILSRSRTFPNLTDLSLKRLFFRNRPDWSEVPDDEMLDGVTSFVEEVFANYERLTKLSFNVAFSWTRPEAHAREFADVAAAELPSRLLEIGVLVAIPDAEGERYVRLVFERKERP